jgi:hypothetical protein
MTTTFTAAQRKMFAKMGIAMADGSYPVRNASDLQNAILSVGRGENAGDSGDAIRFHIIERANALRLSSKIPDTWGSDGSLKHFGVKGMHWGHRKGTTVESDGVKAKVSPHSSEDSASASLLKAKIKKTGVESLSNDELSKLLTRLDLEGRYGRLDAKDVTAGERIVDEILGVGKNVAGQQATSFANKYAAKGIEHLIKQTTSKRLESHKTRP